MMLSLNAHVQKNVTLGREELESLSQEESTELVCAFCKEKYHFTKEEITELLENLK